MFVDADDGPINPTGNDRIRYCACACLGICFFGGWMRHLSILVDAQPSRLLLGIRGFQDVRFAQLGVS